MVANGVDPERFRLARPAHAATGRLTVGFVGTLKPWHGVETCSRRSTGWRRGADGRLLVVGDGPLRSALTAGRRSWACRPVGFTGALPPAEVPALLRRWTSPSRPTRRESRSTSRR